MAAGSGLISPMHVAVVAEAVALEATEAEEAIKEEAEAIKEEEEAGAEGAIGAGAAEAMDPAVVAAAATATNSLLRSRLINKVSLVVVPATAGSD